MRKYKLPVFMFVFIVISQFSPLNGLIRLFFGDPIMEVGDDNLYVTKDLKYFCGGEIERAIKTDCYRQYRMLFPESDPTLCRVQPIQPWKFWRWAQYLTEEKWRQPYRKVSDEEIKAAKLFFSRTYKTIDGLCH